MHVLFRYDDKLARMDEDYPRDMSNWRGVPTDLDGAITWKNGEVLNPILFFFDQYFSRSNIFL